MTEEDHEDSNQWTLEKLSDVTSSREISDRLFSLDLDQGLSFGKRDSLSDYLYDKAFGEGLFSDIKIIAFNKTYLLHRVILYRSPYFATLVSGLWNKEDANHEYKVEFDNEFASQESFEDVLACMYGRKMDFESASETDDSDDGAIDANTTFKDESPHNAQNIDTSIAQDLGSVIRTSRSSHARVTSLGKHLDSLEQKDVETVNRLLGIFTVADFLNLPSVVHKVVSRLIRGLNDSTIYTVVDFCSRYTGGGKDHDRLIEAARCFICMEGYERGPSWWIGFNPQIISEVLRSDGFFVPHEQERCDFVILLYLAFAKNSDGSSYWQETITVIKEVLHSSIYFCHLPFSKLLKMSDLKDIDNTAPLIDPAVLQKALWMRNELHHRITSCNHLSDSDLGLTQQSHSLDDLEHLYIIPIADGTVDSHAANKESGESVSPLYCKAKLPPFRFAVEFHDVSSLPLNTRKYSSSKWYAGSVWNIYLQRVQYSITGHQLGVYLHRTRQNVKQSSGNDLAGSINGSTMFLPRMTFTNDYPWTEAPQDEDEVTATESKQDLAAEVPYMDQRKEVKAYFELYTPARKNKTSLTCFSSVPDVFAEAQSWGWKSSSLWSFVTEHPKESLKFVISLGVV